jgi:hypothetical protein
LQIGSIAIGVKIFGEIKNGFFNFKAKLEDFQEPAVSQPTFVNVNGGGAGCSEHRTGQGTKKGEGPVAGPLTIRR